MASAATTETVRSADGTTIALERSGEGPALILIDAASGYRDFDPMRQLAAHLADEFNVIVYDRRGRGESTDTLPYSVGREVEDLAASLRWRAARPSPLPNGSHRSLPGEWHGVADEVLAPVLHEFFESG